MKGLARDISADFTNANQYAVIKKNGKFPERDNLLYFKRFQWDWKPIKYKDSFIRAHIVDSLIINYNPEVWIIEVETN